jgi:hypothetical protein
MNCELCGKYPATNFKWYQYDSGDQFIARICGKCSSLHSKLLEVK